MKSYLAVSLLIPTLASALSLQEAANNTLKTNPEYLERVKNFNVVREEVNIAYSGYLPKLDIKGSTGSETVSIDNEGSTTDLKDEKFKRNDTEVALTLNIFNGLGDLNEVNRQKMRLTSAAYSALEKANDITLEMIDTYIDVLKSKELLKIAQENADAHKKYFDQVKQRTESGVGSRSEFEQVGSRLALANSALMTQTISYENSLSKFTKIYGEKVNAELLEKPEFVSKLPANIDEALNTALSENPAIKVNAFNYKAAQKNYQKNAQAYLPVVDLEVKQSSNENAGGQERVYDSTSAMLTLTYNLFNGGADTSNRQKSISLIHQENEKINITQRKVKESLEQAWNSYTLIDKQMEFLELHVKLAKSTVSSYNKEFKLGRRNLLDLLIAEGEFNGAKQSLVKGQYDLLYSKYRIENNTGSLLSTFNINLPVTLGLGDSNEISIAKDKK